MSARKPWRRLALLAWLCCAVAPRAVRAQDDMAPEVEILSPAAQKILDNQKAATDPTKKKEEQRPPFEFYRTQVAPFDVLPYVKPNHWVTMSQELRANHENYDGRIRTAPIRLLAMPQAMVFHRDARLLKGQDARLSFQAMLPRKTKEIEVELFRPGLIQRDEATQAPIRPLEPHQMLVLILGEDPSAYATWARYQAMIPANAELDDASLLDLMRYYRLVIHQEPTKPTLSSHPLTWTTISHVVWDGLDPGTLNVGQRQALLDWIHWGGQLVIAGGAGRSLALVADDESFLAPFLPAEPSGEDSELTAEELDALKTGYPVPGWRFDLPMRDEEPVMGGPEMLPVVPLDSLTTVGRRYQGVQALVRPGGRPVYLSGLRSRQSDAVAIPFGDGQDRVLGYERRVGRGRILMLAVDPKEPALMTWKGYDTFVRRVFLRRQEDPWIPNDPGDRSMLGGTELTWVRYVARDLGAEGLRADPESILDPSLLGINANDNPLPQAPVAAWLDGADLPSRARQELVKASGIVVPGSPFVLKVMLGYLAVLVPLNWLVCRFVFRRRELAWVMVPLLALGFAGAVERAAAIDMGFDLAGDEIDVLELQPGYARAHLSRFGVLYCTSRERFTISFPGEPTALALPLNTNLSLRGEEVTEATWQSAPVPALGDFRVEPRSLAMYRAEQMSDLGGTIDLVEGPPRTLINRTDLELLDATIVEPSRGAEGVLRLGDLGPGQSVDLESVPAPADGPGKSPDWIGVETFLEPLRKYRWNRPEDASEIRLVAWARDPRQGVEIEPKVDRRRGFTLVVAHLTYGPPPPPNGRVYDASRDPRVRAASVEPARRSPPGPVPGVTEYMTRFGGPPTASTERNRP